MIEFGLCCIGAFFLFVFVLPLFGALVGGVTYFALPYLLGVALASIAHKLFHGTFVDLGWFWVMAVIWGFLLIHTRKTYQKKLEDKHAWHEGHYLAAKTILFAGHTYRKHKRTLAAE